MCICEDFVCLRRFCVFVEVCRDFECICGGFVYIYGSFCEFVKFCGVLVFMVILCVIVNIFNLYCGVFVCFSGGFMFICGGFECIQLQFLRETF